MKQPQKTFWQKHWLWIVLTLICVFAATLVFSVNGLYDMRVDGESYIALVNAFASGHPYAGSAGQLARVFKPLYGIIGGSILHTLHPAAVILVINMFMYALLAFSSYWFLKLSGFNKGPSFMGTVWIVASYPLLKYGLALGTDISGWALAATTLALGLLAIKKDSNLLLVWTSIIGFISATAKETGPLGLVAVGLLVLWQYRQAPWKKFLTRVAAIVLPSAILYGLLMALIAGNVPNIFGWLGSNNATYAGTNYHSFKTWIAIEASTFGLLWILAIAALRKWKSLSAPIIASFIATLPVLIWPIFISRIVFIQFLWVTPLALLGYKSFKIDSKWFTYSVLVLPVVLNVVLFLVSNGNSLFDKI